MAFILKIQCGKGGNGYLNNDPEFTPGFAECAAPRLPARFQAAASKRAKRTKL